MLLVTGSGGLLTENVGVGEAGRKSVGGREVGSPRGKRGAGNPWREPAGETMGAS